MTKLADPERVLRLARAVVSDIVIYHPELVRDGLANDDLFERMASELAEGREYFDGQVWHGVKKISLENGEGAGVLNEGMAWYLHGRAAAHVNQQGFDYHPGKFTFANVYVNGVNQGMYTHVEQPDKQFLRNRDQWVAGQTWLYKQQMPEITELHEGPTALSPTRSVLNYFPFEFYGPPAPSDAVLLTQLPQHINMDAWLTMGAVNAFTGNGDMLFSKGKNFWFVDYEDNLVMKRRYTPWDLDAVFSGSGVSRSIYASSGGSGAGYVNMLFDIPEFRMRYNEIMLDLLNGPLSVSEMHGYLNRLEPIAPRRLAEDRHFAPSLRRHDTAKHPLAVEIQHDLARRIDRDHAAVSAQRLHLREHVRRRLR